MAPMKKMGMDLKCPLWGESVHVRFGSYMKTRKKVCIEKKFIKNMCEIICTACAFM
jgi:hypothetical protein